METKTAQAVLELIGRRLSRLLSYAYGGFLAVVILHFFDPGGTGDFFKKDRTWELVVLACIVVGAGIYRAHRSASSQFTTGLDASCSGCGTT